LDLGRHVSHYLSVVLHGLFVVTIRVVNDDASLMPDSQKFCLENSPVRHCVQYRDFAEVDLVNLLLVAANELKQMHWHS